MRTDETQKGCATAMKAEIIAVGTELLLGQVVDTNTTEIAESLAGLGISCYFHTSVGDNPLRLAAVLGQALVRSDVVIITGGLGPTEDDLTKEALAAVTGKKLVLDPGALAHVKGFFERLGREMTQNNLRQAMLPEGAEMLPNPRGTAPGVYLKVYDAHVFCLPGVPTEMRTMWQQSVVPRLVSITGGPAVIVSRTLRFYGIGESALEERVKDLLHGHNPTVAPYASVGEARLRITARAGSRDRAMAMIEPVEQAIRGRVGEFLYGEGDDTLESVVGRLLSQMGKRLAVAESCTGGLIAHRITNIPGSSGYFRQGWVVYANEAKVEALGVSPDTLATYGAVSEATAAEMAAGARKASRADIAVAVTGIAGPGGGTEGKPVGTVCFGVATPGGTHTCTRRFTGSREDIKWRSASEALNLVRVTLLREDGRL